MSDPSARGAAAGRSAFYAGCASIALLVAAWILQGIGYAPCELCLIDRVPLYVAAVVGSVGAFCAAGAFPRLGTPALHLVTSCLAVSAALAGYHAGVEQGWWSGPSGCTGVIAGPAEARDLLDAIARTSVVRCDAPALRVMGLSLAALDCIASSLIAASALDRALRLRPPLL